MAARRLHVEDVLEQLLADSSDFEENDDFDIEYLNLEHVLENVAVIRAFDMEQCARDRQLPGDILNGLGNVDEECIRMPFMAETGLTYDLPENPTPLDLFNINV